MFFYRPSLICPWGRPAIETRSGKVLCSPDCSKCLRCPAEVPCSIPLHGHALMPTKVHWPAESAHPQRRPGTLERPEAVSHKRLLSPSAHSPAGSGSARAGTWDIRPCRCLASNQCRILPGWEKTISRNSEPAASIRRRFADPAAFFCESRSGQPNDFRRCGCVLYPARGFPVFLRFLTTGASVFSTSSGDEPDTGTQRLPPQSGIVQFGQGCPMTKIRRAVHSEPPSESLSMPEYPHRVDQVLHTNHVNPAA